LKFAACTADKWTFKKSERSNSLVGGVLIAAVKAVQAKKRKAKGKAGKRPPDALKPKEKW